MSIGVRPFTVCEKCDIRHIDNCECCYGFGVFRGKPYMADNYVVGEDIIPISAAAALSGIAPASAEACPVCKSTVKGAPR